MMTMMLMMMMAVVQESIAAAPAGHDVWPARSAHARRIDGRHSSSGNRTDRPGRMRPGPGRSIHPSRHDRFFNQCLARL